MSQAVGLFNRLRRIGVIGAGQMGGGIAHVCALAGFEITLTDISEEALQRGRETIDRNLSRQVARGKVREEDKAAALERIRTGLDYALFDDCDSSARTNSESPAESVGAISSIGAEPPVASPGGKAVPRTVITLIGSLD